jgi:hypothetical protein
LDLDPISEEANHLLKRVRLEQGAHDTLARAELAAQQLDELRALDLLTQIPEASEYFNKARPLAIEIKRHAMGKVEQECKRLLHAHVWPSAVATCDRYMTLACQETPSGDRDPRQGKGTGESDSASLRTPLYPLFLRARERVEPGAAPWTCSEKKILRESKVTANDALGAKELLLRKYSDKRLGHALFTYWQGNMRTALAELEKVAGDPRAELQSAAKDLRKRVWLVMQLLKSGSVALQAHDPERAEKPFRAALERDRALIGELGQSPSFVERTIQREMGAESYDRGKYWADRGDIHRACRIWKLGYAYSRGNLAVVQAVKHCSERGGYLVDAASNCGMLATAAELAVEGDGLLEKLRAKRATLGCR